MDLCKICLRHDLKTKTYNGVPGLTLCDISIIVIIIIYFYGLGTSFPGCPKLSECSVMSGMVTMGTQKLSPRSTMTSHSIIRHYAQTWRFQYTDTQHTSRWSAGTMTSPQRVYSLHPSTQYGSGSSSRYLTLSLLHCLQQTRWRHHNVCNDSNRNDDIITTRVLITAINTVWQRVVITVPHSLTVALPTTNTMTSS